MTPAVLHQADGLHLLAGLEWLPDDGSSGIGLANTLRGGASVKWRGARAVVRGTAQPVGGAGALLAQMCLAAEDRNHDTTGHWAWVAQVQSDDDNPARGHEAGRILWWLGATDDGRPSQTVTEEIHTRLADLVNALAGISATCELAGIGVCKASADALITATRAHERTIDIMERLVSAEDAYREAVTVDERMALGILVLVCAQVRDTRVHRPLLRLLADDQPRMVSIFSGMITTSMPGILIATFDGSPRALIGLMEDPAADEFCRNCAFRAWTYLAAMQTWPKAETERWLRTAFEALQPQRDSYVWISWLGAVAVLGLDQLVVG